MTTLKSKCSLLVTGGILLTIGIASLNASSESFAEEAGQSNIGITFYGGKAPLETENSTKSAEQPITKKDKQQSQQEQATRQNVPNQSTATGAQTSLPKTGERNSRWLYSLGVGCLLIVLISIYYLNKKRKNKK